LGPLVDAFSQSPQYEKLKKILPNRKSNASYDSMQFVLALMSGFWEGYKPNGPHLNDSMNWK